MRLGLLGVFVCIAGISSASAQTLPYGIPNFCANPTITATANGNWSQANTWTPARLPQAGDIVSVPANTTVTYDQVSDAAIACVGVNGALTFSSTASTRLTVGTLMVYAPGALTIDTHLNFAVLAEIVFSGNLAPTGDPEQYGIGLLAFGAVHLRGAPKVIWSRTIVEPVAGATTLTIADTPTGWNTGWSGGERFVIPDTRQLTTADMSPTIPTEAAVWHGEVLSLVTTPTSNILALPQPLQYDHKGARDMPGTGPAVFLPHVLNITRNVVLRSANPTGTRGHFLATANADVDVEYAAFKDMGRTTIQPLNSAVQNPDGTWTLQDPTQPQNQIGRYPIHMHHLIGLPPPRPLPPASYQFKLIGNAVENGSKWSIAVHNSHFGLVQWNAVYNTGGAGIVTEDGSETQNTIDHNFVLRVTGSGGRDGGGREGVGFWLRGADNIVTNNVAANMQSDNFESAYGYNYYLALLGFVRRPNFPGADTTDNAQVTSTDGNAVPIRKFDTNEVYGATESGMTYYWIGTYDANPESNMPESVIKNLTVWHVFNRGVFHYPANHVTIDGLVVRGSIAEAVNSVGGQHGIDFQDYFAQDLVIKNCDIQGRADGFYGSLFMKGSSITIQNCHLANQANISIQTPFVAEASVDAIGARTYVLRNLVVDQRTDVPNLPPQGNVVFMYGAAPVHHLIALDEVDVWGWNQTPTQCPSPFTGAGCVNFRAYYTQQAPAFVVPVSVLNGDGSHAVYGAPQAGYTNACWWNLPRTTANCGSVLPTDTTTQLAIAGAVASCSTTRPDVVGGFACSPTAPPPPAPGAPGTAVVTPE